MLKSVDGILMFVLPYTIVSSILIVGGRFSILFMPSDTLSVLGARILLTVWKLKGVGEKSVTEEALIEELPDRNNGFSQELKGLQELGFVTKININGKDGVALTPLGLAILRQIEEDKLQELG